MLAQGKGLSPRAVRGHHGRSRSAMNNEELFGGSSSLMKSCTPVPSAQRGRFFNDPVPSSRTSHSAASVLPSVLPTVSSSTTASATAPPSSSCKGNLKEPKTKEGTAFRIVAGAAATLAFFLCTCAVSASLNNRPIFVRGAAGHGEETSRCGKRIEARRGLAIPGDRNQCANVLPETIVEKESLAWLVSAHVDRTPSTNPAKGLRGAALSDRSLPHQYYVRAMEAALHSIAKAEPGANVDVAIFTESQRGGMVDEMGVPIEWDVPSEICEELGLRCTQNMVRMNGKTWSVADSLECIAASDVLVAGENKFSRAAVILSNHVKVLTDRFEAEENEMRVILNPATTIAGMPASQRRLMRNVVADYHECGGSISDA